MLNFYYRKEKKIQKQKVMFILKQYTPFKKNNNPKFYTKQYLAHKYEKRNASSVFSAANMLLLFLSINPRKEK